MNKIEHLSHTIEVCLRGRDYSQVASYLRMDGSQVSQVLATFFEDFKSLPNLERIKGIIDRARDELSSLVNDLENAYELLEQ